MVKEAPLKLASGKESFVFRRRLRLDDVRRLHELLPPRELRMRLVCSACVLDDRLFLSFPLDRGTMYTPRNVSISLS